MTLRDGEGVAVRHEHPADQAPIEMLRAAESPEQFTAVVRAARRLASSQT
jgi:hypothetical protein